MKSCGAEISHVSIFIYKIMNILGSLLMSSNPVVFIMIIFISKNKELLNVKRGRYLRQASEKTVKYSDKKRFL